MAHNKVILDSLSLGNRPQRDFVRVSYQGSRFRFFWDTFKLRLGKFFRVNLLCVLFFLPIVALLIYYSLIRNNIGAFLPFNGNIGIGYPPNNIDVIAEYHRLIFEADLMQLMWLIPLTMLGFVGLAGVFRVALILSWDREVSVIGDFAKGIGRNFWRFFVFGVLVGGAVFLVFLSLSSYSHTDSNKFVGVLLIIGSIILGIFLFSCSMFMCTQSTTFDIGLFRTIGNALLMGIVLFVPNIFVAIMALGPLVLIVVLFNVVPAQMTIIVLTPVLTFGASYVVFVYTMYSHFLYERFLFGKVVRASEPVNTLAQVQSDAEDVPHTPKPKKSKSNKTNTRPPKYRKKQD
jgi:hypothetical protein